MSIYRIACKSEEQRGATQPNIIELGFVSDSDAESFGANLQMVLGGTVVSVDKLITSNYGLPYPAGTDKMCRCAAFDGISRWQNFRVYDLKSAFDPTARASALIAAGYQMWLPERGVFLTPAVVNVSVYTPGSSY